MLAALWVLPISAQSLIGTWVTTQNMEEEMEGILLKGIMTGELKLSADASFSESGKMKMTVGKEDVSFSFTVVFSGGGTWKREGDLLVSQYNPKLAKAELTECDLPAALKLLLANSVKKELKKGMSSKKPESVRILTLTDTTLEVQDVDEKDPQIETFKRK